MKTAMPKILMKAVFPVVCMVGMLHGLDVIAAGWSQNLDAKPVELPCGLKFGEVYEGAIRSTKPNYMNGIESKHCEAVITNDWLGFKEIVVSMTGKRRVSGVLGMKRDFKDFDEAMTNLVALKEILSHRYVAARRKPLVHMEEHPCFRTAANGVPECLAFQQTDSCLPSLDSRLEMHRQ